MHLFFSYASFFMSFFLLFCLKKKRGGKFWGLFSKQKKMKFLRFTKCQKESRDQKTKSVLPYSCSSFFKLFFITFQKNNFGVDLAVYIISKIFLFCCKMHLFLKIFFKVFCFKLLEIFFTGSRSPKNK